jgi:hypothetical protein
MPDSYKKATYPNIVLTALSDQNTTAADSNTDPASDLEMPKRQEHVAKKGRRR